MSAWIGALTLARQRALLVLMCLVIHLPGLMFMPVTDRDEARFAQASKQMVETGDLVNINLQDEPRHKKPIGIYWLQSAVVALAGPEARTTIAVYRLPSLFGAIALTLITHALGVALFNPATALLAGVFMAGAVVQIGEAMLAKTDAVQAAFIALMAFGLMRAWTSKVPGWPAFFATWIGLAGATLIKGPVGLTVGVLLIAGLALQGGGLRWMGRLRPLPGVGLTALLVAPWFIAIYLATQGAFFERAIGGDLAPKLRQGGDLFHGAPPLYHLALLPLVFWPASFFLPLGLVQAWRQRAETGVKFCLAWLVPNWILFEAVPNKLPHYTLPLLPALALLCAYALTSVTPGRNLRRLGLGLGTIGAVALVGLAIAAPILYGAGPSALSLIPAFCFVAAWVWALRQAAPERVVIVGALGVALTLSLIGPRLDGLFLAPRLARVVTEIDPERHRPITVAGYSEASVPFLLGTKTGLVDTGTLAARKIIATPETMAFIEGREVATFEAELAKEGVSAEPGPTIAGLNYSNGRKVAMTLYTRRP